MFSRSKGKASLVHRRGRNALSRASHSKTAVGSCAELSSPAKGSCGPEGSAVRFAGFGSGLTLQPLGLREPCPQRMSKAGTPASRCEESSLGTEARSTLRTCARDPKQMLSPQDAGSPTPTEKSGLVVLSPAGGDLTVPSTLPSCVSQRARKPFPSRRHRPKICPRRWASGGTRSPGLPKFIAFHIGFHKTCHLNTEPRGETRGQVLKLTQPPGHQSPAAKRPSA